MDGFLRQSTASQTRTIGPFIDSTDFITPDDGLTIANTDIRLKKNGAADVAKNSGGGTADVNGMYAVTWDATDTDTVGQLQFSVLVSGALLVWGTYTVLEEAVYDALFAASAPGYLQPTTAGRTLDVTATGAAGIDWANVENPTTAVNLSATNIDVDQVVASVTGAVGSVTGAVGSVTGNVGGNVTGSVGSVATGGITAASFAAGAIDAAALAADAATEIATAVWASGTRTLTSFGTLVADVAAAVWEIATATLTTAGTIGKLIVDNLNATVSSRASQTTADAIEADTQDLQTQVGVAGAGLTALGDTRIANLDATVSSRATPAQVNTEVLDVLNVDTFAEPTGVPPATSTLVQKIGRLYMALRNGLTVTATDKTFLDDGGAGEWKKPLSDDGVTYTEGEGTTP